MRPELIRLEHDQAQGVWFVSLFVWYPKYGVWWRWCREWACASTVRDAVHNYKDWRGRYVGN